jgi:rhamnopyranosyl-N-acetylglucosaminyl-diphospho-decaprenol beta-1,3/1,4-galactofuranosyltransferase
MEMKSKSVSAVVVTHNRRGPLKHVLESLVAQSHPVDRIYVVDNASTDGTAEFLSSLNNPGISSKRLLTNTGGAGGFSYGMKWAYEEGHELIWLMDDDGVPENDALERLVTAAISSPVTRVLNSTVVAEDDPTVLAFGTWVTDDRGVPQTLIRDVETLGSYADTNGEFLGWGCFFNGTLIPRTVIQSVGLPDVRLFIRGDEIDYYFRVRRAVTIATVLASRHRHPKPDGAVSGVKLYYSYRNALINYQKYYCLRNVDRWIVQGKTALKLGLSLAKIALRTKDTDLRLRALAQADALLGRLSRDPAAVMRICR